MWRKQRGHQLKHWGLKWSRKEVEPRHTIPSNRAPVYSQIDTCSKNPVENTLTTKLKILSLILCVSCWFSAIRDANVALQRATFQSSTFVSGIFLRPTYAVDGWVNTSICATTNVDLNPWWTVDLGRTVYVRRVNITTPAGSNGEIELELFRGFVGISLYNLWWRTINKSSYNVGFLEHSFPVAFILA